MKAKQLASMLAIAALGYTSNSKAQATVNWKQTFNQDLFTYVEENTANYFSDNIIDTIAGKLYYLSQEHIDNFQRDFDPSVGKKMLASDVLAAYETSNGKLSWAKQIDIAAPNSFVHVHEIAPVNKLAGMYVVGGFAGKFKYENTILTAKNQLYNYLESKDIFMLRLNASGGLASKASIRPLNTGGRSSLQVEATTTDRNGSLVMVIRNNSEDADWFDINPAAAVKKVYMQYNDLLVVKYDINLNYLNHMVLKSNSENFIQVTDVDCDPSKNIVISGYLSCGLNSYIDVDPSATSTKQAALNNSFLMLKYNANLTYAWHKQLQRYDAIYSEINTHIDATGTILLAGHLDENQLIDLTPSKTVMATANNTTIFIAKYNKNGNYISHFEDNLQGVPSMLGKHFTSYMDPKGAIVYGTSLANTSFNGEDLYMSKIRTAGLYAVVWKNRIQAKVGSSASGFVTAQLPNIVTYKSAVYVTSLLSKGEYKLLASNPMITAKVTTDDASFICKYTLPALALSPEDQVEDNNSLAYKTMQEENVSALTVYPNPATEVLNVTCTLRENETAALTIYNVNGTIVKTTSLSEATTTLNISELPVGMYFVEVVVNNTKEIKKLIKD